MSGGGGGGGVQQRALQFIRRGLTTKEAIKQIQADGWTLASQKGSHKQFTHGTKPGKVTIADHGGKSEIPLGTQKSIEAQAGITLE
ncbi:MAG: type II toxin-antitoxin system HicA family toxin [Deltaproteobacteria bacterium]|nr:type II toxin-antitoxin system HicA family toxin [Deltaproteobacteria bacterium]